MSLKRNDPMCPCTKAFFYTYFSFCPFCSISEEVRNSLRKRWKNRKVEEKQCEILYTIPVSFFSLHCSGQAFQFELRKE